MALFHDASGGNSMRFDRLAPAVAAASLVIGASPVLAATVTVSDISVTIADGVTLTVPSIQVTDGNLDEAEVRALFTDSLDKVAATLATFDAGEVAVPELTLTTIVQPTTPGAQPVTSTTVYRDLELSGVTDGIATSARMGSMESTSTGEFTFAGGETTTGLFNLAGIVGFYGASSGDPAMRPIYRDLLMTGMKLAGPGFQCDIGNASGDEFSSRPLETTMTELMRVAAELEAAETQGKPPSPEALTTFINYYVDIFTAFQSTPMTIAGFDCNGSSEAGNPLSATSGPLTVGSFEPGIYPEIVVDDFRLDVPAEGHFALGNLTWKRIDFAPTLAAIEAVGGTLDLSWLEKNWRELIPAVEGFSFSGLDLDVPGEAAGARVVASVGSFDLSLGDYVNGIPARISTVTSDVQVPLPESGEGSELRAVGIDVLDLDSALSMHWDEGQKSILVDKLELAGTDMGRLTISGIVGNAGPELFSADTQVQTVAALALTVREVTIDIENRGLAPALIALAAAEQKLPPAQFHVALAGMAQALPLAVLGATPEAMGLSQALGGFLAGAPQLTVTLTSINPAGIGLAEFMAAQQDPAALKGKVAIAASISGEPVPFTWPDAPASPPPTDPASPPAIKLDPKVNG
jgi:hypothetical protein